MKHLITVVFSVSCLMMTGSFGLLAQTMVKEPIEPCEWLPAGTVIRFENTERVSSEMTVGKVVNFRVRGHVVVNGNIVIPDGVGAIGRVKKVIPATYNDPASIVLTVTYTRTVDDQTIAVAGDEQTFIGEFKRQGMMVEQGQVFSGTIINNTRVLIRKK